MIKRATLLCIIIGLFALLLTAFILSLSVGSVDIPFSELIQILFTNTTLDNHTIIWQLRMPRTLLGISVGAILAITGVTIQGLFRNPLADPGLIGISSGAALGAAFAIVFGSHLPLPAFLTPYLLIISAFMGGLIVTWLVYTLGQKNGYTDMPTMLLAGVAITALSGAGVGFFSYLADDSMLRKLTFWNMGSLSGANYSNLIPLLLISISLCLFLPLRAKKLNALLLGEPEAKLLGVNIEQLKIELIVCTALGVSATVAIVGMIGFIGLVVPHITRLITGPNHRILLPISAIMGAILLLFADIIARIILAPAELQIGIITALLGAPFFLYLLKRRGLH